MLEWDKPELPLATQADILSISRSSLYYKPVPPSAEEVTLKHRIDEIYTERPYYGSRRITVTLKLEGWDVYSGPMDSDSRKGFA